MKIAVLVLALANLALFVWLRWADAPRHEANLVPLAVAGKRLSLLPGTAAAPESATTSQLPTMSEAGGNRMVPAISPGFPASALAAASAEQQAYGMASVCLIWPIASGMSTGGLIARLDAGGYRTRVLEREVPDYRVFLDGFADMVAAKQAITALREGGVSDLYLLPPAESRGPSLSLGVSEASMTPSVVLRG